MNKISFKFKKQFLSHTLHDKNALEDASSYVLEYLRS